MKLLAGSSCKCQSSVSKVKQKQTKIKKDKKENKLTK
jgi:hypothetical protein